LESLEIVTLHQRRRLGSVFGGAAYRPSLVKKNLNAVSALESGTS